MKTTTSNTVGFYTAVLMVIITLVTFGLALTAIPDSGAFCTENCLEYPYLDSLSQYPGDYYWMYPAILLILTYVALMVSIHFYAAEEKKIFSQIGMAFAIITATILLSDYFFQISVIPASLKSGETAGITLLTQYNPHGIFIALEDLGYLLMSLSFLFMAPVFSRPTRLERAIRWIFAGSSILTMLALGVISVQYGILREDRLEVAILSTAWLVLIVNGLLLSVLFRRQLKES